MRPSWRPYARTLLTGTVLGAIVLGAGGRIAMAMIAAEAGGTSRFTLGGTVTVIMLGAASGLAGALMAIVSRGVAQRFLPRVAWVQYLLFAALLLLVTMRGLSGAPAHGKWYFYPLVAAYGLALAWSTSRTSRQAPPV